MVKTILYQGRTIEPQDDYQERFFDRIQLAEGSSCWLWTGGTNNNGQGIVVTGPSQISPAHRYMYEIVKNKSLRSGRLDTLKRIESCTSPVCVNPDHYTLVTAESAAANKDATKRVKATAKAQRELRFTPQERTKQFESFFTKGNADECWLWQGYVRENGLPYFSWERGVHGYAHHVAWNLAHPDDPILPGQKVYHVSTCTSASCVNPAHLRKGTTAEAVTERVLRQRAGNVSLRSQRQEKVKV